MNRQFLNYTYIMIASLMTTTGLMLGMHSTESEIKLTRAERRAWMLPTRKKVDLALQEALKKESEKNPEVTIEQITIPPIDLTDILGVPSKKRKTPIVGEEGVEEQDASKKQKLNEASAKEKIAEEEPMQIEDDSDIYNAEVRIKDIFAKAFHDHLKFSDGKCTYTCPKKGCHYHPPLTLKDVSDIAIKKFRLAILTHHQRSKKRCPSKSSAPDSWRKNQKQIFATNEETLNAGEETYEVTKTPNGHLFKCLSPGCTYTLALKSNAFKYKQVGVFHTNNCIHLTKERRVINNQSRAKKRKQSEEINNHNQETQPTVDSSSSSSSSSSSQALPIDSAAIAAAQRTVETTILMQSESRGEEVAVAQSPETTPISTQTNITNEPEYIFEQTEEYKITQNSYQCLLPGCEYRRVAEEDTVKAKARMREAGKKHTKRCKKIDQEKRSKENSTREQWRSSKFKKKAGESHDTHAIAQS